MVNPADGETVGAKNLLSGEGLVYALTSAVKNFTGFAPLGLVLTMALGIGLAEETGLISTFMRKTILGAPVGLVTFIIALIGICGNIASDAAMVIVPPIAGLIFYSMGRHPLAGIALGFASTSAGFSANLMIAGTDGLLQGITNEASKIIGAPEIPITANYYFMFVSTFLLAIVGSFVSTRIVEPRLGDFVGGEGFVSDEKMDEVTPLENKGLKASGIALLIYFAIIAVLAWPQTSVLRNAETGSLLNKSPLLAGIIPLILILFLVASIPYGVVVGKIKNSADVPLFMNSAVRSLVPFIVLAWIMGQFIAYFNWTNLGLLIAVSGANLLESAGFIGIPLFVGFILITAFINLFIGSGSAKWAILAPIFVPMFFLLGYNPALTQMLYRIGDSTTNPITPIGSSFVIVLAFINKYDKKAGVGTLLSLMLPFSLIMLGVWIVFGMIWFGLGIPVGIGGGLMV